MAKAAALWAVVSPLTVWADPVEIITGPAHAIDGDTIDISGERLRLHGIDAPQLNQTCENGVGGLWPCGVHAANALRTRIGNRPLTCFPRMGMQDEHKVSLCYADGEDLGAWLVLNGWALAYPTHAEDYILLEQRARAKKRGVWKGSLIPPWLWRREHSRR